MRNSTDQLSTRMGKGMIYAAWIVLLGLLTIAFNGYLENQTNPNKEVSYLVSENGRPEVILDQNRYGHYVANGKINGRQVTFLLDTGATMVSVPGQVAKRLNLKIGAPYPVRTANGITKAYNTQLDIVSLGAIELHDVRANINPGMQGEEVLLGMSFMKHLEMIQKDNRLLLRQY